MTLSPPPFEKEPILDIDDIKMEPVDIDMPPSPTFSNENQETSQNDSDNLPLIVEINSLKDPDFQEPPMKKQSLTVKSFKNNDKTSPITIERLENTGVQLTVEKISPNDENQDRSDVQKKFCIRVVKTQEKNSQPNGNEKVENVKLQKNISDPPLITVKKFASTNSDGDFDDKELPPSLRVNSPKENLPSTSKINDLGFKKIKLTTTESVLKKLAEGKDNENEKNNCANGTKEKEMDVDL